MAVALIGELNQDRRVHRRQQDDLPEHIKVQVYFENHGPGHKDTGYYVDLPKRTHTAVELIKVSNKDFWAGLLWKNNQWITNQGGILHTPTTRYWKETDPQHPHHVNPEHFSPTLHTAIKQPEEEILAGGVHHIATLQGSHPFTEQTPILPQIKAAVHQGIDIPLNIAPVTAIYPQLSIQTTMAAQQEEINVATRQTGQETQRINVITNPADSTLKGNLPFIFNGDRSTTRRFLTNFNLWWKAINWHNDTIRKPFTRVITLLSYMNSTKVDAWKEEQMQKLQEAMDDRIQETNEDLWKRFIERFKMAFTNQNQREEAYQKLCKLKQGDSLDDFFASFKQLSNEAGVPLDDKGTIETLKHGMNQPLTRAVIQSPDFDPNVGVPWTFKQWEKQARKSYQKWQAAAQFS